MPPLLTTPALLFGMFCCSFFNRVVQAIELGNIPEALPSLSGSSRWSLGSLSLLPTSTAPTSVSCMSDDAEGEPETLVSQAVVCVCIL